MKLLTSEGVASFTASYNDWLVLLVQIVVCQVAWLACISCPLVCVSFSTGLCFVFLWLVFHSSAALLYVPHLTDMYQIGLYFQTQQPLYHTKHTNSHVCLPYHLTGLYFLSHWLWSPPQLHMYRASHGCQYQTSFFYSHQLYTYHASQGYHNLKTGLYFLSHWCWVPPQLHTSHVPNKPHRY